MYVSPLAQSYMHVMCACNSQKKVCIFLLEILYLEHLQQFGNLHLANLVICQVAKLFAK
jgi:hypothetical protein